MDTPLTVASRVSVYFLPLLTVREPLRDNNPVPLLAPTLLQSHSVKVALMVLFALPAVTGP